MVGLIVIAVEPLPLTLAPVTSIVSIVLSSDVFFIVIFPLSASTASLKVKTIFIPFYVYLSHLGHFQ